MPAYNFKDVFAAAVESGRKQQTIRKTARGARPGATAYLYTGQRTKHCRKLGEGIITDVLRIEIDRHAYSEPCASITDGAVWLIDRDLDALARADGFATGVDMVNWFDRHYGLPFVGYLHKWVLR